ncbi:hypothetical protein SAMN05216464_10886 [Mucilaginibacter pineti]|uniref:Uncharacterized protein n=1 Tax=Mucilaginibacter pineti TaxID=1391627 RepID=A0A1G7EM68_9SPHI|nr:hypothetical protein [Mucilaginibacter pineti]SDE64739.1 hypothetical protein SAMN05216464_10886 [Mucilaginibacter pineti]
MGWFEYLKSNGHFAPEKNPQPVKVKNGFSTPRWEALDYLEKVAQKIADGDAQNYIDEIIAIIINASEKPVDNYISWYRLISILSKLPNKRIPVELIEFQHVWVKSQFDTGLQTAEIAENLLPKFLTGKPDDTQKALMIFTQLFAISILDHPADRQDTRTYETAYDLYNLQNAFVELKVLEKVNQYLGTSALNLLADQVNILLRDHHRHFDIKQDDKTYHLSLIPISSNLKVVLFDENEDYLQDGVVEKYADEGPLWPKLYFTKFFSDAGLTGTEVTAAIEHAEFTLTHDLESIMGFYGIRDLEEETESGYALLHTFSYILVEWLSYLAIEKSAEALPVLRMFAMENRFQLPFFKRILFYVFSKNWSALKTVFWEISGTTDEHQIFSEHLYHKELYQLLESVSEQLDETDVVNLKEIIRQGPVGERHNGQTPEAWRHRWLQGLKSNIAFNESFETLSAQITPDKDYAEEGKVLVRVGSVSPYTPEEILALSIDDLLDMLLTFRDRDRWEDPTVEGLGEKLQEAVKQCPEHFIHELHKLLGVDYFYVYHIIWGFTNALKTNHLFDWLPVLHFCLQYIKSEDFINDSLGTAHETRASQDWVFGQVAYLISEGTRAEVGGFDDDGLLAAKEIVITIANDLKPSPNVGTEAVPDFVMHSLNHTQGKVMRSILDCALKEARDRNAPVGGSNWEPALKIAFEKNLRREVLDGYTLQGMYLSQFMFLDDSWLRIQIVAHQQLPKLPWLAFMAGVAFGKPISGDFYPIMQPHYQRALDDNLIDLHYHQGLLRHFVAYYFWNYDIDYKETFLYKLINRYPNQYTPSLVQFLNTQIASIVALEATERQALTNKIIRIWKHLLKLFSGTSSEGDSEPLKGIIRFVTVLSKLDQETTKLIINTLSVDPTYGRGQFMIKQLTRLNEDTDSKKFVAIIAGELDYTAHYQPDVLKKMLTMLYDSGEKDAANGIINQLVILGHHYLKELYLANNSL